VYAKHAAVSSSHMVLIDGPAGTVPAHPVTAGRGRRTAGRLAASGRGAGGGTDVSPHGRWVG
jgi:hypothetical protein